MSVDALGLGAGVVMLQAYLAGTDWDIHQRKEGHWSNAASNDDSEVMRW